MPPPGRRTVKPKDAACRQPGSDGWSGSRVTAGGPFGSSLLVPVRSSRGAPSSSSSGLPSTGETYPGGVGGSGVTGGNTVPSGRRCRSPLARESVRMAVMTSRNRFCGLFIRLVGPRGRLERTGHGKRQSASECLVPNDEQPGEAGLQLVASLPAFALGTHLGEHLVIGHRGCVINRHSSPSITPRAVSCGLTLLLASQRRPAAPRRAPRSSEALPLAPVVVSGPRPASGRFSRARGPAANRRRHAYPLQHRAGCRRGPVDSVTSWALGSAAPTRPTQNGRSSLVAESSGRTGRPWVGSRRSTRVMVARASRVGLLRVESRRAGPRWWPGRLCSSLKETPNAARHDVGVLRAPRH